MAEAPHPRGYSLEGFLPDLFDVFDIDAKASFRLVGEQIDWRTKARNYRLPKGHPETGETTKQAALREVAEETGRRGRIDELLAEHEYAYDVEKKHKIVRIQKRVIFYLMEDAGPAEGTRDSEMVDVFWLSADDAHARLTFENERMLIRRAQRRLKAT